MASDDSPKDHSAPKPPKKRYTELPIDLDQKRDCKADLFSVCDTNESNNNEEHRFNEEVNKDDAFIDDAEGVMDETIFRGVRSCKGVRYQKFLAEQQRTLAPTNQGKRRRLGGGDKSGKQRRNSMSSNISEKTDSLSSEGGSTRSDLEHLVDRFV